MHPNLCTHPLLSPTPPCSFNSFLKFRVMRDSSPRYIMFGFCPSTVTMQLSKNVIIRIQNWRIWENTPRENAKKTNNSHVELDTITIRTITEIKLLHKPSFLCIKHVNGRTVSKNDHTRTSHIPEGDELFFSSSTVSKTKRKDMQGQRVCYVLNPPTNHMLQLN